jgi:aconitase A
MENTRSTACLPSAGITANDLTRLPYSIRVLLENLLRKFDGKNVTPRGCARRSQLETQ